MLSQVRCESSLCSSKWLCDCKSQNQGLGSRFDSCWYFYLLTADEVILKIAKESTSQAIWTCYRFTYLLIDTSNLTKKWSRNMFRILRKSQQKIFSILDYKLIMFLKQKLI